MSRILMIFIVAAIFTAAVSHPERTAIVSLMVPAEDKVLQKYTNCLKVFVRSLRVTGYMGAIVVLSTEDTPNFQKQQIRDMNVTIKIVSKISAKSAKNRSLLNMLTKLHVWGMIEFDQVLFFDSDFLFLRNPASAFQECGGHAFCACADTGIGSYSRGGIKASNYFNSGFMVIRPSEQVFAHLTTRENIAKAEGTQFVDQDMLNNVFQGRWKRLDSKYNLMHVHGPIANRTIAVHEKLWIMQEKYPTGHWIWNKHRSQVESLRTESGFAEGMHALKRRRFHSSLKSATEKADPQSLLNQKDNRNSDGEEQENAKRSIYYSNRRTGA